MLLQTHFKPNKTNTTVHQLNVAPNQVNIPKSPSKYNTPTANTAQLNQHGQPPSVGHTPLIAFFAIINHPSMKFFDFTVFNSLCSLSYLNIYNHWGMKEGYFWFIAFNHYSLLHTQEIPLYVTQSIIKKIRKLLNYYFIMD